MRVGAGEGYDYDYDNSLDDYSSNRYTHIAVVGVFVDYFVVVVIEVDDNRKDYGTSNVYKLEGRHQAIYLLI